MIKRIRIYNPEKYKKEQTVEITKNVSFRDLSKSFKECKFSDIIIHDEMITFESNAFYEIYHIQ